MGAKVAIISEITLPLRENVLFHEMSAVDALVLHAAVEAFGEHAQLGVGQMRAVEILESLCVALTVSEVPEREPASQAPLVFHEDANLIAFVPVDSKLHSRLLVEWVFFFSDGIKA